MAAAVPAALCVSGSAVDERCSWDGVDWRGHQIGASSLFALYCNVKPLVACAILRLADEGIISLDDTVGRFLPSPVSEPVRMAKLIDLLGHRSGLQCNGAIAIRALEPALRKSYACSLGSDPRGRVTMFADAEPWFLVGWVLEAVYGAAYHEAIGDLVLRPYLVDGVFLDGAAVDLDQVALSGVDVGSCEVASVSEVTRSIASEWNPAFGGYTTANGIHRFMVGVGLDCLGAGRVLSATTARLASSTMTKAIPCNSFSVAVSLGLGFMINGVDRCLDYRLSPAMFGHLNQGGRGFCFVDLAREEVRVVTGFFLSSLETPSEIAQRRSRVVAEVCDELGW